MGRGCHYNIYKDKTYFMTMTVIDWIDLFNRVTQKQLIVDSLKFPLAGENCQRFRVFHIIPDAPN